MIKRLSEESVDGDRSETDAVSGDGRARGLSSISSILLIDDNPAIARAIDIALRSEGHRLEVANGPAEAWSRLAEKRYAAILLDLNFSGGAVDGKEGLECLRRIIAEDSSARVVVITAHSGVRIAVAAMQAGARDFVTKPWRNADLIAKLRGAMARDVAAPEAVPAVKSGGRPTMLIGESPQMHDLRGVIRRVGPTNASVAVTGLPGSGRTLVSEAVHAASSNAAEPVARIDLRADVCWEQLRMASGTIILRYADHLDEVAQERLLDQLSPAVRCISVVGSTDPFIPALRRRLATIEIAVPPLADRGDDVLLLARHFARIAGENFGKPGIALTLSAEAALRDRVWEDEVRGLALTIERAVILAGDGSIDEVFLTPIRAVANAVVADEGWFDLNDAERTMIESAMREHRHNVTQAAAALGLSRGALYRRLARYGL